MRPIAGFSMKSFQFFSASQRLLTEEQMAALWRKSISTIYKWGNDPMRCDDNIRNPIDLLQATMERLLEIGRSDIVEGGLHALAEPLGYTVSPREIRSDRNSSLREMGDVNTALGRASQLLNESLEDGKIDDEECAKILPEALNLVRQAREFVDAIMKRRA